nr:Chain D, Krev interaction trapped protein 1 [Homo sapiens]4TKN_E Chain E, Krev interaction trapped protein 1 [Homo sapiens]4TKN_F Chain F, Krev interaction trapped protein 1 [Homo sapiens]
GPLGSPADTCIYNPLFGSD